MALAAPKLDDRQFQDIVDEAKKRIPHYCPEWTDHNVSDPGVTLIELFAWMTDIILYRLNQVPDLHYVKLLELLGTKLEEPVAARVPITFWLSAPPQEGPFLIPGGTEVASTQTETELSIVFTTDDDFWVAPPQLRTIVRRVNPSQGEKRKVYEDLDLLGLKVGLDKPVKIFTPKPPAINDALYFGFENDLSHHILRLKLDFDIAGGADVIPARPPTVWQACIGDERHSFGEKSPVWRACDPEIDTTKAMSEPGKVQLHLPKIAKGTVNGKELFWVRVKVETKSYTTSPRLHKVRADSWGATIWASHAQQIPNEVLGQSDGSPGQRFQLQVTPVLKRTPDERLTVSVDGQIWEETSDFAGSEPENLHFTLDRVSGELCFGPAVRQPSGDIKKYGAVPPRGAKLILQRYWSGGGQAGNVRAGFLNTLKMAIPGIARVENREPARGGQDEESLEAAMLRARAELRTRERAVTAEDFEYFARKKQELRAQIGRVKCLQLCSKQGSRVAPGHVELLVIPRVANPIGYLKPDQLELGQELYDSLKEELDERRLLATPLRIRSPQYRWVAVKVELTADPEVNREQVGEELVACLNRFLNPLTGGPDGKGWPFGHKLSLFDVYRCLPDRRDVEYRNVEMYAVDPGGESDGVAIDELRVGPDEVIASGRHRVEFVDQREAW